MSAWSAVRLVGYGGSTFKLSTQTFFKALDIWGGGSAVQGPHNYGSVLGGAGGDGSEQKELDYFTEAVKGMAAEDHDH